MEQGILRASLVKSASRIAFYDKSLQPSDLIVLSQRVGADRLRRPEPLAHSRCIHDQQMFR